MRKVIIQGDIGEPHQVVITSRDPGLAPAAHLLVSGDILRDMMIHDLDMARLILGEEVTPVFATGSRFVAPDLIEKHADHGTLTVVLTTLGGKRVIITNSGRATYGYDQRIEALGTKGIAISVNRRPQEMTLHTVDFTDRAEPLLNFFIARYREALDAEFVDAVEVGRLPSIGIKDGRPALALAGSALKSIAEAPVVTVKEVA